MQGGHNLCARSARLSALSSFPELCAWSSWLEPPCHLCPDKISSPATIRLKCAVLCYAVLLLCSAVLNLDFHLMICEALGRGWAFVSVVSCDSAKNSFTAHLMLFQLPSGSSPICVLHCQHYIPLGSQLRTDATVQHTTTTNTMRKDYYGVLALLWVHDFALHGNIKLVNSQSPNNLTMMQKSVQGSAPLRR